MVVAGELYAVVRELGSNLLGWLREFDFADCGVRCIVNGSQLAPATPGGTRVSGL